MISEVKKYFNLEREQEKTLWVITGRMWTVLKNDATFLTNRFNTAGSGLDKLSITVKAIGLIIKAILGLIASIVTIPLDLTVSLAEFIEKKPEPESRISKTARFTKNFFLNYPWKKAILNSQPPMDSEQITYFSNLIINGYIKVFY